MRKSQRGTLRRRQGMTLIEMSVVIMIMALIATGAGMMVMRAIQDARVEQTITDAQGIRSAALAYYNNETVCPESMDDLIGPPPYVDPERRTVDAWGNDFSLECEAYNIHVSSAGPNGEWGDDDDLP